VHNTYPEASGCTYEPILVLPWSDSEEMETLDGSVSTSGPDESRSNVLPPAASSQSNHNEDEDDFQDLPLGDPDVRFSMIPLQTPTPTTPHVEYHPEESSVVSELSARFSTSSIIGQKSPRSSRRITTSFSNGVDGANHGPVPFMLARLEQQRELLESDPKAHRASLDGHGRLKDDFHKFQMQQEAVVEDEQIDWGMSCVSWFR
jgi:hypothetical protein